MSPVSVRLAILATVILKVFAIKTQINDAPWTVAMSLNATSVDHLMNFVPLFCYIMFTDAEYFLDIKKHTMIGTLNLQSIRVIDVPSGFKDKSFNIEQGFNHPKLHLEFTDITFSFVVNGSFVLLDIFPMSFDNTWIQLTDLNVDLSLEVDPLNNSNWVF